MSLIHLTECLAAPGQEDRLRTALEAMIEPSLDEPGCLAYCIYTDPNRPARVKALDTIMRKGILHAYAHGNNQYPAITNVLFLNLASLLTELGIDSVKHLQHLLPMLSESLIQAAKTEQVDLLISTLGALQAVIFNAWPRLFEHRVEVMRGLTVAWLVLEDGDLNDGVVKELMVDTVGVLHAAMGEMEVYVDECRALIKADGRLGGLLGGVVEKP